ncbi:hypothetical protein AMJ44_06300 [candidate division WOR-1 bacterium DG_54_3]|uniref:Uncharacterized protein n=1 Tax=candidate division WOR-1 bacterium DG_54_3 TaxID=1703775 RepID=A0A0S7Y2D9_UNCSA|nr:MAG: hypothetical protein AMJ44_06300 [candidate division WOR-1 bacterium DG_54_3]
MDDMIRSAGVPAKHGFQNAYIHAYEIHDYRGHRRIEPAWRTKRIDIAKTVQVALITKSEGIIVTRKYKRGNYAHRVSFSTPVFPFHDQDELRPFVCAFSQKRGMLRERPWEGIKWQATALCLDDGDIYSLKGTGHLLGNIPLHWVWVELSAMKSYEYVPLVEYDHIPFAGYGGLRIENRFLDSLSHLHDAVSAFLWRERPRSIGWQLRKNKLINVNHEPLRRERARETMAALYSLRSLLNGSIANYKSFLQAAHEW